MPVKGISFNNENLKALDRLAAREGQSRSGMIARLVERASQKGDAPDIRVDGQRFVPEQSK